MTRLLPILCLALLLPSSTALFPTRPSHRSRTNRVTNAIFSPKSGIDRLNVSPTNTNALLIRGGSSDASTALSFLNVVDVFGTALFAFSGALTAGRKGMDLLGMLIIATITAVGGGTVRDVILDNGVVFWLRSALYVKISFAMTLLTYFLWPTLEQRFGWKDSAKWVCYVDAFCLGAFAVIGTQKAMDRNLPSPVLWIVSGLITSVFGGIIRDVICQQPPRVMYPYRTLYGAPPLLGSAVYTMLNMFKVGTKPAACISIAVTFITRVLSFNSPQRLPYWTQADDSQQILSFSYTTSDWKPIAESAAQQDIATATNTFEPLRSESDAQSNSTSVDPVPSYMKRSDSQVRRRK